MKILTTPLSSDTLKDARQNPRSLRSFSVRPAKIDQIFSYRGLGKEEVPEAIAGDIVALTGVADANIGDTIYSPSQASAIRER